MPPPKYKRYLKESRIFSPKGTGMMAGGGFATFKVPNTKVGVSVLKNLQRGMAFWQVSQRFIIKGGRRKSQIVTGYSKSYKRNQISETFLKRAISDAAVNAANSLGYNFKYEGGKPEIVKPKGKAFNLLIWFTGEKRQTLLRLK